MNACRAILPVVGNTFSAPPPSPSFILQPNFPDVTLNTNDMDLDMLPSPDELPAASGNVERLLELFRLHMESLPPFFASYHIKESHVTEKTFRSFLQTIDSDENLSKWVNEQAS